jgi:23S rRNA U2552 (ribose-2'-O)-methylase RlmE/FtsJ
MQLAQAIHWCWGRFAAHQENSVLAWCCSSPTSGPHPIVAAAAQGAGTQEFTKLMQRYFKKVARMRVEASRSMSREFYAIGLGRKPLD